MKKIILFHIIFISIFSLNTIKAQERVVTFGVQVKPIIPLGFFDTGDQSESSNGVDFTLSPKTGMSFGMVIRKGFTKSLSLETGINLVSRKYDLTINDADSNFKSNSSFKVSSYEIPLLGLVYVQINDKMFMNVAGGCSFDIYPTELRTVGPSFSNDLVRYEWINVSLLANVGWEYRTAKSGYFYLGASLHKPFSSIFREFIVYDGRGIGNEEAMEFDLSGNYFTIDIRYFFHEDKQKKKKKKKKKEKRKVFIDPRKQTK